MGVNAQIEVPAFTAGQVLTAAEMTQINTGIPVFATTVTRDAAFGGAGEKVLAEGQFAYIEATNTTQYYDGAAWQSVGVAPGLVLVKTQTIGSGVSSVAVTSAFSSTYDNYKIIITGGVGSASGFGSVYLGTGAAPSTGYYRNTMYMDYGSSSVFGASSSNAGNFGAAFQASTNSIQADFTFYAPNLAKQTNFISHSAVTNTTGSIAFTAGFVNDTTQYTGFTFVPTSGTFTGGTVFVYGFQIS